MKRFVIDGGKQLKGTVEISGAKNAAVAIIPAAILVEGVCRIENIPQINDVTLICEILQKMGANVKTINKTTMEIDCSKMTDYCAPTNLARKMRASYYLLGALLGRFYNARVDLPGGCDFGVRPIDLHIKGFEALGASVNIEHGIVYAKSENLNGANIYLDNVSVGATINIMLAAVRAQGQTVIENAAKEPHIVDVANFLNSMGANIKGAGTDVIKITGVSKLHGGTYTIIPDQIEAGTYMVAAAAVGGEVLVTNVIPKHLESISAKLTEIGATIEEFDEAVLVKRDGPLTRANVKTLPYPGFPTDMQPQITTLLSVATGTSIVNEGVWDNRFKYVDELKRMGAQISVDGKIAVIEGVEKLTGAIVKSCDLRAGAAMVIAGLMAKGITKVEEVSHIERGYENIVEKLRSLGAQIYEESYEAEEQTIAANKIG
ncbi:MAG: UDP-N-acetylglucosamine 1-carboxyvinyltransferase [Ruminococcaceae bacterium]|nr:UDP-N-acetylglucosamine 1-carboxyvinyltransferase [Oscillospiraceae bacterium]